MLVLIKRIGGIEIMSEIRLKKIVDDKRINLEKLSSESLVPYSTLKKWYETSDFDSNNVGVHELTNVAAALNVDIKELIDFPKSNK